MPAGVGVAVHSAPVLEFQPGQVELLFDTLRQVHGFFLGLVVLLEFAKTDRKTEVVNKDFCCTVGACFLVFTLRHFCTSQKLRC